MAKLKRHLQDLPVRKPFHPIAAPLPIGALTAVRPKIVEEKLCQRFSHKAAIGNPELFFLSPV
jgi:hypothetical protein